MNTVSRIKLTNDGPDVSRLASGMMGLAQWELSLLERITWIHDCVELGITTFDHADLYGDYRCEQLFGEALADDPSLREKIQIVTKCGIKLISSNRPEHLIKHYDTSINHIMASVENSIQALKTDYVDLLLLHRPDPLMDADELAEAFSQLKQAGKVLHFGVSNFKPSQFSAIASRIDIPLVTNQVAFSAINTEVLEDGTLDMCQQLRIHPMVWAPLGGGRLFHGNSEREIHLRETLLRIGDAIGGATLGQTALAWLLKHPSNVIPVLGSGNIDNLQQAVQAEKLTLSREQWFTVLQAAKGHDVP